MREFLQDLLVTILCGVIVVTYFLHGFWDAVFVAGMFALGWYWDDIYTAWKEKDNGRNRQHG